MIFNFLLRRLHNNCKIIVSVLRSLNNNVIFSLLGWACFDALSVLIIISNISRMKHQICMRQGITFIFILGSCWILHKISIFKCRKRNFRHITGGGIVVIIVKSGRVSEISIVTADLFNPIVHHFNEIFFSSANKFSQNLTRIASWMNHSKIQKSINAQFFADSYSCHLSAGTYRSIVSRLAHFSFNADVLNIFKSNHSRYNLCKRSRIKTFINIFLSHNRIRIVIKID